MKSNIKPKWNLVIDIFLFVWMMAMTGVGFLLKYVLVPGFKRNELYGRGRELFFWGMDRHQWGSIHFALALLFSALLVLHIILHWNMIIGIYKRMVPHTTLRVSLSVFLIVIAVLLAVAPFFINPTVSKTGSSGQGHVRHRGMGLYQEPLNTDKGLSDEAIRIGLTKQLSTKKQKG